jgi:hypothetical protein
VLKESVQLKISCLEDMQRLLEESRCQNLEYKELFGQAVKDRDYAHSLVHANPFKTQHNKVKKCDQSEQSDQSEADSDGEESEEDL